MTIFHYYFLAQLSDTTTDFGRVSSPSKLQPSMANDEESMPKNNAWNLSKNEEGKDIQKTFYYYK